MKENKQYIAKSYNEEYVRDKADDMNGLYPGRKFGVERSDQLVVNNDGSVHHVWWLVEYK